MYRDLQIQHSLIRFPFVDASHPGDCSEEKKKEPACLSTGLAGAMSSACRRDRSTATVQVRH